MNNNKYFEAIKNNIKRAKMIGNTDYHMIYKKDMFISNIDDIIKNPRNAEIINKLYLSESNNQLIKLNYIFKNNELLEILYNDKDGEYLNAINFLLNRISIYNTISSNNLIKFNKDILIGIVNECQLNPVWYDYVYVKHLLAYSLNRGLFNDINQINRVFNIFKELPHPDFKNCEEIYKCIDFMLENNFNNLPISYVESFMNYNKEKISYVSFLLNEVDINMSNISASDIESTLQRDYDFVEREQLLRKIKKTLDTKELDFGDLVKELDEEDFSNKELYTLLYKLENEGLPDNSVLDSLLKFIYPNFVNLNYTWDELSMCHYALKNKKKNFLKQLPSIKKNHAFLLNRFAKHRVYKILSLNEISESNFEDAVYLKGLENICLFTKVGLKDLNINEFKTLSNKQHEHIAVFGKLINDKYLKRDDKLRLVSELPNLKDTADILSVTCNDAFYDKVITLIKTKSFSSRVEEMNYKYNNFSKCKISKKEWLAYFLIDDIDHLKSQVSNLNEIKIIINNHNELKECNLLDLKQSILYIFENAKTYSRFKLYFEGDEDFIENNKSEIFNFFLDGRMEIFNDYYTSLNYAYDKYTYQKSLRNITKAEILGKLDDIKFFKGDLSKEIDYDIDNDKESLWKNDLSIASKSHFVGEMHDYHTILTLGENPVKTCMSYKDGTYNYCLLSNFDANKKVIVVKSHGTRIARAILRLTKICCNDSGELNSSQLSFRDISQLDNVKELHKNNSQEELVLFLEKVYTSDNNIKKVKSLMIQLASKKAKEMNLRLIVAEDYNNHLENNYSNMIKATSNGYIYISESKNGLQYLDSFTGRANRDTVGYIPINKHTVLIPNGVDINEGLETITDIEESAV